MKIEFNNLAPIKHGVFEEKDLTIIIGDNGTGKTILLETVTFIKDFYTNKIMEFTRSKENKHHYASITPDFDNNLLDFIEGIDLKEKMSFIKKDIRAKVDNTALNNLFFDFIENQKRECIDLVNERVLSGLDETLFEFKLKELPEFKKEYEGELHVYYSDRDFILLIAVFEDFSVEPTIIHFDRKKTDNIKEMLEEIKFEDDFLKVKEGIDDLIKKTIFKGLYLEYFEHGNLLYLPSERSMYRRNAMSNIADFMNDHNAVSKPSNEMRYSESLFYEEYLRFKAQEERRFEKNNLKDLAESMDNNEDKKQLFNLYKGKLIYDQKGEIVSILRNSGLKIPRRLFSTKETKLIPYDMISNEGTSYERLIIEEPEANMSLASMKDLIKFFSYHLFKEKKMTLTTHSDVFFSRINNLILGDNKFTANVYELVNKEHGIILEEKSKNEYGYEIELFKNELNNLFEETLKIQDGANDDIY